MTHEWFDPTLPLSGIQLDLVPSGAILPSSEANFWDYRQYPTSGTTTGSGVTNRFYYNNNSVSSGINYGSGLLGWQSPYIPSGTDGIQYWDVSGILKLDGPFESPSSVLFYDLNQIQSGIFYYQASGNDVFFASSGNPSGEFYASLFSNASGNIGDGINNFTIFNDYIHNYPSGLTKQAQKALEESEEEEGEEGEEVDKKLEVYETRIPYLSDLKKAEEYSVYGLDTDYLGYNATGSYGVFSQGILSREYPTIGKFFGPESEIL